jgi:hypothetical protein
MKHKGYRSCNNNFDIDSDVKQFDFSLISMRLKIDFFKEHLAPIERVDLYLKDGRLFENVFIVDSRYAVYYERSWYYLGDPRSEAPLPEENVFERFDFCKEDVILIRSNNHLKKIYFDLGFLLRIDWLFGVKPNRHDTKKSIELNIFVNEKEWKVLPERNDMNVLYSSDNESL